MPTPHPNDKTHPRMVKAARLERDTLNLRAEGLTEYQIADQLGVTQGAVSKALTRALTKAKPDHETVEALRILHQTRIEQRRQTAINILQREHPILHQGRPVQTLTPDGKLRVLDDDSIKLSALATVRDCDRDMASLWGLDAASKWEGEAKIEVVSREAREAALLERTRRAVEQSRLRALPAGDIRAEG